MNTSDQTTTPTASAETPIPAVSGDGTTVVLGDTFELTIEQAGNLGRALVGLCDELTPASLPGLAVVTAAAEGLGFTLLEVAERCGLRKTNLDDLTSADLGHMSRELGTMFGERRGA